MGAWKSMLRYFAVLLLLVPIAASLTTRATDVGPARMVVETKSAFQTGDTMAFWFKGRVGGHSPNAHRMVFDGDLTSLATGDKAGTFTWDLTCYDAVGFPCWVYEVTNTFRLAGGTIVTRGTSNWAPDATAPGFFHIGIHPSRIIEATGVYAGRTGEAHMSGRHGAQEMPAFAHFDDFWVIELDPRA